MRIRTIKPDFFLHEALYEAEKETGMPLRVAYSGLWCAADREGRFKWEPRRLGVSILPYDNIDFSRVLHALTTRGFIKKYTVNDSDFGLIPTFTRHQVINNKEAKSILPEPVDFIDLKREGDACLTRGSRVDHACRKEGKGREGKGKEEQGALPNLEIPVPIQGQINPPLPPKKSTLELPGSLDFPDVRELIERFIQYRREAMFKGKKKPLFPAQIKTLIEKLAGWGRTIAKQSLQQSMMNNWPDVYEPRAGSAGMLTPDGQMDWNKFAETMEIK